MVCMLGLKGYVLECKMVPIKVFFNQDGLLKYIVNNQNGHQKVF